MSLIYKPSTSKGPVFLHSGNKTSPPTITLSNGQVVQARYLNTIDEGGGPVSQYVFPNDVLGQEGATLSYGGKTQVLKNTNMSYRGDSIGGLQESSKGAVGSMSGVPGAFAPGMVGQFGVVPANILAQFPKAQLAKYDPIKAANYNFTDPFKFAEKYGSFNRGEYEKNFNQSQDLALRSLENELKSLGEFIPAMGALKRQEVSADNQFNQQQRTDQINNTLPGFVQGINSDLSGQRDRATSYANGRIPDGVTDRAFELGIRSAAADRASAGGFGAQSSVARKASDLMSAEERVKLSQYGDQLLGQNVGARENFANFQLAPTEYSNAGGQVNINPSVNFSQIAGAQQSQLNAQGMLPTSQAFSSQIGQEQFKTGINQQTNQFNASNKLQLSEFNANTQNDFAMSLFGYKAGYANSVASAGQTDVNTQFGLQQQQLYNQLMQQYMGQSQNSQLLGGIFSGVTGLLGSGGLSNLTSLGSGKGGTGSASGNSLGGGLGSGLNPTTSFPGTSGDKGSGLSSGIGGALKSLNPF